VYSIWALPFLPTYTDEQPPRRDNPVVEQAAEGAQLVAVAGRA
jgi:hypothetical protein